MRLSLVIAFSCCCAMAVMGCSAPTAEGVSACNGNGDCPAAFPICRSDMRCWSTPDPNDASTDGARADGGDAGRDAGRDTGTMLPDVGIDAVVLGLDSGVDAGMDAFVAEDAFIPGTDAFVPRTDAFVGNDAFVPGTDAFVGNDAFVASDAGRDAFVGTDAFMCGGGMHLCGSVCRSNNSVASCGSSCMACVPPADSTPTCDGTSCGFTCDPTFHACGSTCASDASITQCGTSCMSCSVPANGSAICVSGACNFTCNTGYTRSGGGCTASAPHQVTPLSGTNVSTRRPMFRWVVPTGLAGAHLDVCTDRACSSIVYSADVTGSSHAPTFNLPVGVVYWRLYGADATTTGTIASPTWQLVVPARSAPLSTSWGGAPDFNGDGYTDVVSCPGGPMEVRFGSATGLPMAASRSIPAGGGGWYSGAAIDVDGDGFSDLLGIVTDYAGVSGIQLRTFRGGPAGLTVTSQLSTTTLFSMVASAGDLNGDGYGDAVAFGGSDRVHVFFGSPSGLPMTPSYSINDPSGAGGFGASASPGHGVAEAGDLDADGYSDLVIGQPGFVGNTGRVYVYRGGPSGPMGTPIILEAPVGLGFGAIVLGAGDVNGDGREDIIVGLCAGGGCFGNPPPRGAYVYYGSAAGVATTPSVTLTGRGVWFGSWIGAGMDITGDGYSDIVVSNLDELFVFPGGASGVSATASQMFGMGQGNPTANVGDTNGDHFADIAVGSSPNWLYYLGAASGLTTTPVFTASAGGMPWFVRP